ncbi:arginase-like protein [Fadolivirus algeromassiliense]|jgi:arginase family enzyme|uniref:Arginase-like protein n=1 Tax=Fadolivirus FV1/VV64 TaxID=3070911 RepID=A0A7D3UTS3_9VIRU|nr:arginase-like protein [Fadolivirus algeromassiliense]QKF93691.1 arginase-like protein [Fadolivirus FV1/VV64]
MSKLHFIKAPCHQSSREQGFQFAPDEIKQKYDFEISTKLFNDSVVDIPNKKIELCKGYELLYKYILEYTKINPSDKIITIGGDHSISSATIAAINEKCMKQYGNNCTSDLVVLWIDSYPDLNDFTTSQTYDLNDMPVASLLGLCDTHFISQKLLLKPEQFIFYGLVDKDDIIDDVKEFKMPFLTTKKIKTIGLNNIIKFVKDMIGNKPVFVSLDMKVFNDNLIRSVIPSNEDGLELEYVTNLLVSLKNNIIGMDLVEFNPRIGSNDDVRITRETIRYILSNTFDIKEKSINIFTEDSQFLIYRPLEQDDPYVDIGWYILRGLTIKQKEELIKQIPDDTIITLEIEGDTETEQGTYLVTKTTLNEQNEKSYAIAETISDTTLFPQEKICMGFELING